MAGDESTGKLQDIENAMRYCIRIALWAAAVVAATSACAAGSPCQGLWADVMIGSHHIHPYRQFDDFNPGFGFECSITQQWAATLGSFATPWIGPPFMSEPCIRQQLHTGGGFVWAYWEGSSRAQLRAVRCRFE